MLRPLTSGWNGDMPPRTNRSQVNAAAKAALQALAAFGYLAPLLQARQLLNFSIIFTVDGHLSAAWSALQPLCDSFVS